MSNVVIEGRDITRNYGELSILNKVSLEVCRGEVVSIVGASGAGKSTLLHILGTLDKADSGEIILCGKRIAELNATQLASFRNEHVGFVFQFHHLLPEFTALENIMMPALIAGKELPKKRAYAMQLASLLEIENRLAHKPSELSGGEQQRVAVARALINTPDIVFADEPTGNLDSKHAQELHQLFITLRKQLGQTFLVVTHNTELAKNSDKILHMQDGSILELAP